MRYVIGLFILVALVAAGAVAFAASVAVNPLTRYVGIALTTTLIGVVWLLAGLLENMEASYEQ